MSQKSQTQKCQNAYSITSSALASSVEGMVSPSVLAVLTLMTSSNLIGLHDRQIRRFNAFDDLPGIDSDLAIHLAEIDAVAHQASGRDVFPKRIHSGHGMARRQRHQLFASGVEKRIAGDGEDANALLDGAFKGSFNFPVVAGSHRKGPQANGPRGFLNALELACGRIAPFHFTYLLSLGSSAPIRSLHPSTAMISSASARTGGGISKPSVFAALRLMTNTMGIVAVAFPSAFGAS